MSDTYVLRFRADGLEKEIELKPFKLPEQDPLDELGAVTATTKDGTTKTVYMTANQLMPYLTKEGQEKILSMATTKEESHE